jgi:3-keto-disaccharide hydrolase
MRKAIVPCLGVLAAAGVLTFVAAVGLSQSSAEQAARQWKIHDRTRPHPSVITPGECSTPDHPGRPPSDATVLFDGKDLSQWAAADNGPAKWTRGDGFFATVPGTGYLHTRQAFGDCQLHVEWATPNPPRGVDQDRGNSGVFLQGLYEVQVLDSYNSVTYADGQAAAIYGQYPPLVNACRPPGEWQTYDIVFHGPRFDTAGKLLRPATITVIQNGVLVQDHVTILGPTEHGQRPPYKATPERLPLALQDHNHPVRFRNIWIRELPEAGG